jgi:C4-dicarboxylate-specific signal transduction histidine kinase
MPTRVMIMAGWRGLLRSGSTGLARARVTSPTRRRGVLLAGLAALVPLVVFAALTLRATVDSHRRADESRMRAITHVIATAVDAELSCIVRVLETLAASPLLADPNDAPLFEAHARIVGERLGGWVVLVGPPPDYPVLAHTHHAAGASAPGDLRAPGIKAFSEAFTHGRTSVSDLFTGAITAEPTLAVIVPVGEAGPGRRLLALGFRPAMLNALLDRLDLPAATFAAISDGNLAFLAHSLDPDGRHVGLAMSGPIRDAVAGVRHTGGVSLAWPRQDGAYSVERLRLAPGWAVTVAEPPAWQTSAAWGVTGWLLAGCAALTLGASILMWATRREALRDAWREAAALRDGRADVQRLHDALPAVIFLREVAPDGTSRPVYRGGDIERVTGWPRSVLAAPNDYRELVHPDDTFLDENIPRLLRDGQVSYEWRMRQPDASWRRMHTLARVLSHRPDGSAEVVGYTLDVTARRDAEDRATAAARLASLGEIAAGLAHELKQPLQAISLAAEVAQIGLERRDEAVADRSLKRIVEQAHRTADLIERLRRLARGTEDQAAVQPVRLIEVVRGTLDIMRAALRDAGVVVEVALGEPPPVVLGQLVLLEQVLSNLLLNARDALALRPAASPRRIRIAATRLPDGMVELVVADTGGGIAPTVLERLFEPFVTTKGAEKGTGLGLSICHGLVTSMGGRITAHNAVEGAVFTLTLHSADAPHAPADPPGEAS